MVLKVRFCQLCYQTYLWLAESNQYGAMYFDIYTNPSHN